MLGKQSFIKIKNKKLCDIADRELENCGIGIPHLADEIQYRELFVSGGSGIWYPASYCKIFLPITILWTSDVPS
jgi:hypothetical protein